MRVMDVVNETKAAMRVTQGFGEPYEKNGVTRTIVKAMAKR